MIKSDKWIRRMAASDGMIEPFEPGQVREVDGRKIVSYGTSSYGYDIRCSREFKIFTNINSTIVDPKAFDAGSFVDFTGDVCIIPPNSFALARTVEYFRIPRNVLTFVSEKGRMHAASAAIRGSRWSTARRPRSRTWRAVRIAAKCSGATASARMAASSYRCSMGRAISGATRCSRWSSTVARRRATTPDHEFMLRDGRMMRGERRCGPDNR